MACCSESTNAATFPWLVAMWPSFVPNASLHAFAPCSQMSVKFSIMKKFSGSAATFIATCTASIKAAYCACALPCLLGVCTSRTARSGLFSRSFYVPCSLLRRSTQPPCPWFGNSWVSPLLPALLFRCPLFGLLTFINESSRISSRHLVVPSASSSQAQLWSNPRPQRRSGPRKIVIQYCKKDFGSTL